MLRITLRPLKRKLEKVIFNTADWVSEPKKINFANVNFEKFGAGSNKNMEIKFIFRNWVSRMDIHLRLKMLKRVVILKNLRKRLK